MAMFIILHLLALIFFIPALFVTIPLHIIAEIMSANQKASKKKKYDFKLADIFTKKATWAKRKSEWLLLVESDKDKSPKIGERVVAIKQDKTYSYEKIDEVLEYTKTKHLGYRWICRHVDLERID